MDDKNGLSNIIVENRKKMNVTGVLDVISFDDESVILDTQLGAMIIKGDSFKINKLSTDAGEMAIEGNIASVVYEEGISKNKESFFSRLFR